MTLFLALGFYVLGAISMGLFMVLMSAWHYARRPKRHLFSELKEGMDELASTRREPPRHREHRDAAERRLSREGISDERDRVQYEWINLTGEEK
jgi:hypothetical protein